MMDSTLNPFFYIANSIFNTVGLVNDDIGGSGGVVWVLFNEELNLFEF